MADIKIISETPIDMHALREELEKVKKRDKELNFRAAKTEEYLHSFPVLKNSAELYKKIDALKIPRLKDIHIAKIIDILPKTLDDLKAVLQGYPITVNNDNLKKVVDTVNKFIAEK